MSQWHWRESVESAWFYAAWFCLFAAAVLFVAQRKYGERQAGIERRFQARTQPLSQPNGEQVAATHFSTPQSTIIPLWPLGVVLVVLACVFGMFAVRTGIQRDSEEIAAKS